MERRAYRAWQRALPLAPINHGPDQYGQPWFGYVDRLRAVHATARAALDALTARMRIAPTPESGSLAEAEQWSRGNTQDGLTKWEADLLASDEDETLYPAWMTEASDGSNPERDGFCAERVDRL